MKMNKFNNILSKKSDYRILYSRLDRGILGGILGGVLSGILISFNFANAESNSASKNNSNSATEIIQVMTMEMPPYVMPMAKNGIVIDVLNEIGKKAGFQFQFAVTPLKRAAVEVKESVGSCVAPMDRSQERETEYKWIGPVLITQYSFFSLKNSNFQFDTFMDAKTKKVGLLRGSVVEEILSAKKFEIEIANDDFQNVKKLQAKRFELWASDSLAAPYWARQEKVEIENVYTFATTLASMACNKSIEDKKIEKMNHELTLMYKDGRMKKIFNKYMSELGIKSKVSFLN